MKIEQVLSPRRRLLGTFCVKNTKNKRRKGGIIVSENNCFREWDRINSTIRIPILMYLRRSLERAAVDRLVPELCQIDCTLARNINMKISLSLARDSIQFINNYNSPHDVYTKS